MVMRHLIILLALLCVSCNASLPSITPFKMDIQQGNVVTSKMMLQLKPGMTKSQVRFVMGTPLIQDGFHPDRWDYFYQMQKQGKIIEQRRVTMDFENDALVRIRGDVIPAGSGQSVAEPQAVTPAKNKSKKAKKEKSLLDRLQFWKDDEEVTKPQAAPEELVKPASAPAAAESAAPSSAGPAAQPAQALPAEPAPASEPAPSQPTEQPAAQPAPMPAEPAPTPDTGPVEPSAPVEPAPATETAPAPQPAPVAEPEPAPEPQPAATPTPAAAPAPTPAAAPAPAAEPVAKPAKPAAAAEPEPDLPPEDDPSYFERMLEKIGF